MEDPGTADSRPQQQLVLKSLYYLRAAVMMSRYRREVFDHPPFNWTRYDFEAVSPAGFVQTSLRMISEPNTDLHDYRYIRPDFRVCEALNRRRITRIQTLQRLTTLERRDTLSDLARSVPEDLRIAGTVYDS